ncbi:autotransporter outer membrane beta-barrel domain-containing protein [Stenotrophomonas maltophilia]|nr:autotransporter outer membrane beta-barrel domain-containing protein [Stenotrophomonas maltophilia]
MRMMQFTPKIASTFVRSRLSQIIATALILAGGASWAQAQSIGPGQTLVITPGSPREGTQVSLAGGTLIVRDANVGRISSASTAGGQPSSIQLYGATLNNASTSPSQVANSNAILDNSTVLGGMTLSSQRHSPERPRASITANESQISGHSFALNANAGGTLNASRTQLTSDMIAIRIGAAAVNLRSGSSAIGEENGIRMSYSTVLAAESPDSSYWGLLVDDSRLEGRAGAALSLAAGTHPEVMRVALQNNAVLVGGNGNIIEIGSDAAYDITARTSTLKGDITIADTATGALRFLDGLDLTGRILGPADVTVDQGGRWTLSGDSNTGNLTLGAGSDIFLGAAGTAAYPQLTVNGNYAGNGGTLHFNTVLAGDDAASSRMHVTGDTSGTTQVTVNNIAGAGAQTVNGIPLVQVDGASNGRLALQGRAIGGMYEYFLRKGTPGATNGNWYLTSAYTGNPCDINPALPECKPVDPTDPTDPVDPVDPEVPVDPVPVLRPEPGAYLANQAAAVQMFQLRRHDRGEPGFDRARIGTWVRAGRDQLQANVAGQVDARTHINTLQLGSDVWRWGDGRGQVGVMLGSGEATTQAVSTLSGYGTRGKVKGKSAGVYLGWVQDAQSSAGLYVDGWLQAARFDNEVQGEGIARETYDSRTRSASLEAGYAWAIRSSEASTLYLQPQAQLTWTDYDGDSLVENNGTTVEDGRGGGLNSRLGVRLFGQGTLQGNRVQPFLAANWLRGQRDASMRFNSESLNAKTPENRYEVQAGAQLQLGQRWSTWGDLRVQRGDSGYRNHGAQVGLRAAW